MGLGSFAQRAGIPSGPETWLIHEFRAVQVNGEAFQEQQHYASAAHPFFHTWVRIRQGQSGQLTEHFATIGRFLCVIHVPKGEHFRVAQVDVYKEATREKDVWLSVSPSKERSSFR